MLEEIIPWFSFDSILCLISYTCMVVNTRLNVTIGRQPGNWRCWWLWSLGSYLLVATITLNFLLLSFVWIASKSNVVFSQFSTGKLNLLCVKEKTFRLENSTSQQWKIHIMKKGNIKIWPSLKAELAFFFPASLKGITPCPGQD